MLNNTGIGALAAVLLLAATSRADVQDQIDAAFNMQMDGATLTEVRGALEPLAGNDAADFALGTVDFLLGVEGLLQEAYRTGFLAPMRELSPMTRGRLRALEWIRNDEPEQARLEDLRAASIAFVEQLAKAERTLADAEGDFTCIIDITRTRFDIDADGEAIEGESVGSFFALFPPRSRWNDELREFENIPSMPARLVVAFDRGDAAWLRGYCHLLSAGSECVLAHDWQDLFDRTAHIFFPNPDMEHGFLPGSTFFLERATQGGMQTPTPFDVTDVLVFFGNMEAPVAEPERMKRALGHLRASVALGKEMWTHYDRETDNDREWIPNGNQTAAFAEVSVNAEQREAWVALLDECDDLLAGRKVMRFWRGDGTRGIDVPKVFNEPREFNLLNWIQGSAAGPYLREGEFTEPGTWTRLEVVFDRRVFRHMFWFN